MKQQVLKALANPSQIFYVPYALAVINFLIQFIVFVVVFVISLVVFKRDIQPLWFLLSVIIVHMFLIVFSKRDPQIGQIISAKINLLKHKIPGKLPA